MSAPDTIAADRCCSFRGVRVSTAEGHERYEFTQGPRKVHAADACYLFVEGLSMYMLEKRYMFETDMPAYSAPVRVNLTTRPQATRFVFWRTQTFDMLPLPEESSPGTSCSTTSPCCRRSSHHAWVRLPRRLSWCLGGEYAVGACQICLIEFFFKIAFADYLCSRPVDGIQFDIALVWSP